MTHYCSYEMSNRAGSWRGKCRREHPTPLSRSPTGVQLPAVPPTTLEGSPWDLLSRRVPASGRPSGSSPFASPTAVSEALARLLPWERSSIPSHSFLSLFLAQERSASPSRHVSKPFIPSAVPSEGYYCLLRASRRCQALQTCFRRVGHSRCLGSSRETYEKHGTSLANNLQTLLPPCPALLSGRTGAAGHASAHLPAGLAPFLMSTRRKRRPAGTWAEPQTDTPSLLSSPPAPAKASPYCQFVHFSYRK